MPRRTARLAVDVDTPDIHEGLPFRGATLPHGMVMFGPNGQATAQGYSVSTLQGAEVSHLLYEYVVFRPTILPPDLADRAEPVRNRNPLGAPGYFHDTLPEGIDVQLTTTARTGMAAFRFPTGSPHTLRLGVSRWELDPDRKGIAGFHDKGAGYKLFFAARFDRPIMSTAATAIGFAPGRQRLVMKVGVSYVSVANARGNLEAENPGWSFASVRRKAASAWRDALAIVDVEGGSKSLFDTCLYRCYLQPNLFTDSSGEYLGFDGKVHDAGGRPQYANYSLWDTYRTWAPLMAMLEPDRTSDMVETLVRAAQRGGGAMPRWATANRETGIMEEGSATPFVASAYAFGARRFDVGGALRAMDHAESTPGARCQETEAHPDLELFLRDGYIPQGSDYNRKRAASFTLEYGMSSFALSQMARAVGDRPMADRYLARSEAWRHLFNSATGYLQSRNEDGSWYPDRFDPAKGHFIGFTEGNSAQYTWTVRHDMKGLIELVGGREVAARRLDVFFEELNAGPDSPHCWIGNEPSFAISWAYHWCGMPWKSQQVVDRILDDVWKPGGIPGADDLGTMSAWYVLASLGLFPAIPGTDVLVLTSPRFKSITIATRGEALRISTSGAGRYIQDVRLNGRPVRASWLRWSDLSHGGELRFVLGRTPSSWGTAPEDEPPSYDGRTGT